VTASRTGPKNAPITPNAITPPNTPKKTTTNGKFEPLLMMKGLMTAALLGVLRVEKMAKLKAGPKVQK
jgi:hypothetical protein